MKKFTQLTLSILILFSLGCAAAYKPISPDSIHIRNSEEVNGIDFSYKYGVLQERGNNKYAKKEQKKGIKVLAVRFENNTDRPLTIGQDIQFYSGNSRIAPLNPAIVGESLKQNGPIHLLYLLLSPLQLIVQDGNSIQTYPIGLVVGPGLAIGNTAGAGGANANFKKELLAKDVIGKVLAPGQTFSGLIGIYDQGYSALTIKVE